MEYKISIELDYSNMRSSGIVYIYIHIYIRLRLICDRKRNG